jgi:hypothetical protein
MPHQVMHQSTPRCLGLCVAAAKVDIDAGRRDKPLNAAPSHSRYHDMTSSPNICPASGLTIRCSGLRVAAVKVRMPHQVIYELTTWCLGLCVGAAKVDIDAGRRDKASDALNKLNTAEDDGFAKVALGNL